MLAAVHVIALQAFQKSTAEHMLQRIVALALSVNGGLSVFEQCQLRAVVPMKSCTSPNQHTIW